MSTAGVNPEDSPRDGEFVDESITLDSRFPQIVMPKDTMWPLRLHDEATKSAVSDALPKLVSTLSEPVSPATESQIHDLFAANPRNRRTGWTLRRDEDGLTYSSSPYEDQRDRDGNGMLHLGINYTFDENGRLTKFETIEGNWSYDKGRPGYQEFLKYDEDGYLLERTTWARIMQPSITDRFEYTVDEAGHKTPAKMTRTQKVQDDSYRYEDSDPMTVDLANYEEWLATNPNGFSTLAREQLEPKELAVNDFSVSEHRRGILFAHPEQLEHALVMYGDGSYPTPGGETALEYNDKAFAESYGSLSGMFFSLTARSGDMHQFVQERIMGSVQAKWNQVQKSPLQDAEERVGFSFDYDGAGHFHKTGGDVTITKNGLELSLHAAYVGDKVEDQLASALQVKRGLRSATIEVPINQTERDGYFFVDIKAACERLGVPVTDEAVSRYLGEYLFENEETPRSRYDRQYGKQPALWEDEANGITVDFVTERHDYDSDTDLDTFFQHDATAIWGPLPKEVRRISGDKRNTPRLRLMVKPTGSAFDAETTERTDDILRSYMNRLQRAS